MVRREAERPGADRPKTARLRPLLALVPFLRPYRGRVAAMLAALLVGAGVMLGFGVGLRYLVDAGFVENRPGVFDIAMTVLLGLVAVMATASFLRVYLVNWLAERVVGDLRRAVFDRVVALPPSYYERTGAAEVLSRLTTDSSVLQTVVVGVAAMALRNGLMLAGGTVMLAVTSPGLTALVFLVVPAALIPLFVVGRRVRRLSRESQDRIADVTGQIDESLNAIRTVQAYAYEGHARRRFARHVEAAVQAALRRARMRALLVGLVIALVFAAVAAVLWVGGRAVLAGTMTPGELSAFLFYALIVAGSVNSLGEVAGELQRAAGASERLAELLRVEPEIAAPRDPAPLPEPPAGRLAFEGVRFAYPSRPASWALADFDLAAAPGETVALVGPSGAGKTTVFQLALRFYDPQAGAVYLDGIDLRRCDPVAARRRMAWVPQEPVLFTGTVAENIRFARPEADDWAVRQAARAAYAEGFVDGLPQGFATHIGERGVQLSGGQRQRIAIARAVLADPAILLLDEATSALDAESEQAVQAALEELMAGRTTLIIAHRLATVRAADRIAVLEAGGLVQQGRHSDLIARGGLYARLAELQFAPGAAE